jgi:hypothetical protein
MSSKRTFGGIVMVTILGVLLLVALVTVAFLLIYALSSSATN